jgi:hypothetical protein
MRRRLALGLLAALAIASPAEAHSWTPCIVTGILVPGTARCTGASCVVTVRPERIFAPPGLAARAREPLVVSFSPNVTWTDRDRPTPWPDLPAALAGLADARVRLAGDLDHLDGHWVLLGTRRLARVRATPPASAHPPVFGACGQPPWSEATIARCSTPATRSRKVTVTATLESDADAPPDGISWASLDLEAWSVKDPSGPLEPPFAQETATVPRGAWFASAGRARPTVADLRAGDRVSLEATYEMPAPSQETGVGYDVCAGSNCEPSLRVREIRLIPAP